jgi:hypothetical protein
MFRRDPYLWAALLGIIGGMLTYWGEVNKGKKFRCGDFLCAACTSGLLGYLICLWGHGYGGLSFEACGALAGLAGLLGEQATDLVITQLRERGLWFK